MRSQIVIGFVGGFVHKDDVRHSEVQLARRLAAEQGSRTHIEVFENREAAKARHAILKWLDRDHDGKLSADEKHDATIVLFGHSWGAAAVVSVARELHRDGIPVSLTVQVDTISRNDEDSSLIPANVTEAANFYQSQGVLHGLRRIRPADPSRTRILGNFAFRYDKEPAPCQAYPWYDRLLFKGHTSIECDPHVWSTVEGLIRQTLSSDTHLSQVSVPSRTN